MRSEASKQTIDIVTIANHSTFEATLVFWSYLNDKDVIRKMSSSGENVQAELARRHKAAATAVTGLIVATILISVIAYLGRDYFLHCVAAYEVFTDTAARHCWFGRPDRIDWHFGENNDTSRHDCSRYRRNRVCSYRLNRK